MPKRTRLSICRRKVRYPSHLAAMAAALAGGWVLRPYRCDRCGRFHLTSRRKGRPTSRAVAATLSPLPDAPSSGSGDRSL